MPSLLLPDAVFNAITEIDPEWLIKMRIRGLALDVDNTIAKYSEDLPAPEIFDWFRRVSAAGIEAVVVSNNKEAERVAAISRALGVQYVVRAGKPRRRGFLRAKEILGLPASEIAAVGDQIFTDVLGAKRAGFMALIVHPRGIGENPWFTVRRWIETPFIRIAQNRRGVKSIDGRFWACGQFRHLYKRNKQIVDWYSRLAARDRT